MADSRCFHCGLPVTEERPPRVAPDRAFCCQGCKAVYQAIVDAGHEDYYRHRDEAGPRLQAEQLEERLARLGLYDNPEIQQAFVREQGHFKEAWLILEEIRCAACVWLNEQTLRQLDGVLDVEMDYAAQQVRVSWDPDKIRLSEILAAISHIGYIAYPFDPRHRQALNQELQQRSLKRILFAAILGMMILQTAIGGYFLGDAGEQGQLPLWIRISRWTSLLVTGVILAYPGQLFFRNAWRDLKNRSPGMDVPIALGLSAAWLGSLWATVTGRGEVYYESITMFVLFILLARHFELRGRIAATALLDRLARIVPAQARRIEDGVWREVSVLELKPGDRVGISPGETVPVDGRLLSAVGRFDESLLTGEVQPVPHRQGDSIVGGSINLDQPVEIEVVTRSADSALSRIQQLTRQSVTHKPHYTELAERIAGRFVIIILLVAALTAVINALFDPQHALSRAIAVLIVTCPCALALASPLALSFCAAGLARLHVLPVRMSAIEAWKHIDTLVFDKTGTLTQGTPQLCQVLSLGDCGEQACRRMAASLERGATHPVARAVLAGLDPASLPQATDLVNHSGQGIEGRVDKRLWFLGSEAFVTSQVGEQRFRARLQPHLDGLQRWRAEGASVVYLASSDGLEALFVLSDPLREGARAFVRRYGRGRRTVILSGDHTDSVEAIGRALGVDEAHGGCSPEKKLDWIRRQQRRGHQVLMMGDGINDAPVLAAANISLSFSDATDLARSHCDFLVMRKDFLSLIDAFPWMEKARAIVVQNLGWAVLYNVIAVPAAALGWVTPWMAAIGMSLSSFVVLLNSFRLRVVHADGRAGFFTYVKDRR